MNWVLLQNSALLIFGFMVVMFFIAQRLKDNSIVDIGWGIGFVLIAISCFLQSEQTTAQTIGLALIAIWGFRLAIYIYGRNIGSGEDYRYAQWREEWGKYVVIRAFFQVFMLQGAIMLVVASPLYVIFSEPLHMSLNVYLGIGLWTIGFYFEAMGDNQMKRFKANPDNKGIVMRQGVWKYTRHPNYFGDATQWWAIFLIAAASSYWYLAVIGPAVMHFFLVKVSGVALLEQKYKGNPKYADYIACTNAFIPWFPKKGA
ncbi:MAG: steroid 5-alpha reductase family enzyme [Bacteroidia bacterium]|jgi:steroid 5-alpha reductase family enzyme